MFKKHSDIATAFFINIFFLILCIIFGELRFGALDDYFMAAVLTGAHGSDYNVHMYFVNALYGYALLPLYHLFPKISWYYIGEMLGVFVSLTMASYLIIKKIGINWGTVLSAFLVAMFCQTFYLQVQFTQCAALFAATGMATLMYAIPKKSWKITVLGCFLLLWGSLMRWDAFLMGLPFWGVAALFQYKDVLKNYKQILVIGFVLFIAIWGARTYDRNLYTPPEYKSYKTVQGPRAAFGDGSNYDKDAVIKEFENAGYSAIDYNMLKMWTFYDTEVFSPEKLQKLASFTHKHTNVLDHSLLPSTITRILSSSVTHPVCFAFFIFGALLIWSNPKKGVYPWAALGVTFGMLAYLIFLNRVVLRVENGFWTYATLLSIPSFQPLQRVSRRITYLSVAIICITFAAYTAINSNKSAYQKQRAKEFATYQQMKQYMDSFPNTMFLVSMTNYSLYYKLPPYMAEPFGSYKNFVSFGYWTPYLPEITQSLQEHNITNPIKDVINDNVIVIGAPLLGDYLQEHYYDSVTVDTLNKIGIFGFYKYHKVEAK